MAGEAASTAKRMPAEERREQLLDVTAELVAEQGFQAVSIQAVARRAGISRPIVYEHFGDLPAAPQGAGQARDGRRRGADRRDPARAT